MDNNGSPPPLPDAPDKEKMDQIRNKRLAKLQNSAPVKPEQSSSNTPTSSNSPSSPAASPSSSNAPTIKISSSPKVSQPQNPFNQLRTSSASPSAKPAPQTDSVKRSRDGSESHSTPKKAPKEESIEDFENRILSNIFRITLNPDHKADASGNKFAYLSDLRQELEESNTPMRLTVASLEQGIVEAASKIPSNRPILDYLLPCWKRVIIASRGLKGYVNAKDGIVKEAKRLCMSYCIFAVTLPDLFGREHPDHLVPYLLAGTGENKMGLCHDFLGELVTRFNEDESVKPMLVNAVVGMSTDLRNKSMIGGYTEHVEAMKMLVSFPAIVTAIAESPHFQLALSAPGIETNTILGPFFRISPLQPEALKTFFPSATTIDPGMKKTSQSAMRMSLQTHQKDLVYITNAFIRGGVIARDRILDWFAYILNQNHKRRAIRVEEKSVSSDGFMFNVTVILDVICEPFMDATFEKVNRIEIDYLRRKPRVDIGDETKLNADQNTSDAFYDVEVGGTNNFISEAFFLTLAAHHYGSEAMITKLKSLKRDVDHFKKAIAQMEAEREKIANSPFHRQQFETMLKKYTDTLEKSLALKYTIEGVLEDDLLQNRSLLFMRYVIAWLLRIASNGQYTPGKPIKLPLSSEIPENFNTLPEYVLDDIVSNFSYIFRYMPHIVSSTQTDELIALCVTFLTNSEYIKNPYLKTQLVTILFHGCLPFGHRSKGVLGDTLTNDKFANDFLLHALMKWYIECESTGTHSQFYDKFNIRYEIFQVIKCVWTNDVYKQQLMQERKTNTEFFIRFVNLLLNDATYVLDEALTKFPKIHELEKALDDPTLSEEERAKKEEELKSASDQAKSYMNLCTETISMMKLFTSALSNAFTMPEVVTRLADMLDYNLDLLVGNRSLELKVKNKEGYNFSPRHMLNDFVEIYMNLGSSKSFIEAVAKDARSYKPENFAKATRILKQYSMRAHEDYEKWEVLLEKFRVAKELDDQAEEDLGDIPDEFLDPLMFTLMEDPVILPMSRQTVDRSTIRSHLLSDPKDPFNRQPMSIEDVIDDVEMKAKIVAFRAERKASAKQALEDRPDAMDTTE